MSNIWANLLTILVGGLLVNNFVMNRFLGCCPFLGVSKQYDTAKGMSMAVIFVMTLASFITWFVQHLILVPLHLEYMQTIAFILVIAVLVGIVEMALKKISPSLYQSLGVYLPLITTNCAVLGVAILNMDNGYNLLESTFNGFCAAAGFGLATGQIKFFVGAFYLFFINSVFIALATYLMVRFLKYEKNAFIDKVRERNVKRLMMVITLVTFIPSVVIGFHMVRVSLFEAVADKYVAQVFRFPHTRVIECNKHYAHGKDPSQIELLLVGEPIGDEIIENARAQMRNFGLEKAELVVRQANKTDEINVASLQQSYLELLEEKNRRIGEMTAQLKRYRVTNVEVDDISREVGVMMENIKAISLMKGITFDVAGTPLDTTLVCVVTPKAPADSIDRKTLASWLRIRTKVDNVKLFVEP